MLAASARRAGFLPLVVDSFADSDLASHAHASRTIPEAIQAGFHTRSLLRALAELVVEAPSPPIGLVLGAGFEETPDLVARLGRRHALLGCGAEAVRAAKDPARLFPLLAEMGIRHPETSLERPADGTGWLSKRVGGSGGTHIKEVAATSFRPGRQTFRRYYQRRVDGVGLSVLVGWWLVGVVVAFTRLWVAPAPRQPYRYGGAVGHLTLETELEAELVSIALPLGRRLGLVGLVSFDFVFGPDGPLLVDVNPRPGATLDVLDDDAGTLLLAHVAACRGGDPAGLLARQWRPRHRAAAYLYAGENGLEVPAIHWPDWTADRPHPGSSIAPRRPVVTVMASAENPDLAASLCRNRLETLAEMLYGRSCPSSPAEHRC